MLFKSRPGGGPGGLILGVAEAIAQFHEKRSVFGPKVRRQPLHLLIVRAADYAENIRQDLAADRFALEKQAVILAKLADLEQIQPPFGKSPGPLWVHPAQEMRRSQAANRPHLLRL